MVYLDPFLWERRHSRCAAEQNGRAVDDFAAGGRDREHQSLKLVGSADGD